MHDRTRVVLEGDRLIRKAGWFWRKSIDLREVCRIEARNVDALTSDRLHVVLADRSGRLLSICETDEGFLSVINALESRFPGVATFDGASPKAPLQATRVVLWQGEA